MAISTTWITSMKTIFISTGILTVALFLKLSVPLALDFSSSQAPLLWSSFLSWLEPPYLFIVINGIIIGILASSRLTWSDCEEENGCGVIDGMDQVVYEASPLKMMVSDSELLIKYASDGSRVFEVESAGTVVYKAEEEEERKDKAWDFPVKDKEKCDEEEFVISRSDWIPPKKKDSVEFLPVIPSDYVSPADKPLVSARFAHRKPVKASPEGGNRALKIAKPKRQETLENTWKMITDGRAMPLTRHLKKSDTWENHGRHLNVIHESPPIMKKSETFKDRTNYQSPPPTQSPVKLRKEASLSQDELNRRVEAFIKKFNNEMRMQRVESLKQYNQMVN